MAAVFVRRTTSGGRAETNTTFTIPVCPAGTGGIPKGRFVTLAFGVRSSATLGAGPFTDSRGNTWYKETVTGDTAKRVYLLSAYINTALQEGDTLSVTVSASPTNILWMVAEFTGLIVPSTGHNWLDVVAVSAINQTVAYSFNTPATAIGDELIVSVANIDAATGTNQLLAGSGYSLVGIIAVGGIVTFQIGMEYKFTVTAAGVQNVPWTRLNLGGSQDSEACAATYKLADILYPPHVMYI